jgi:hypothetical protein
LFICIFVGYIIRIKKTTNKAIKTALDSRPNLKSKYSFYEDHFEVNSVSDNSNSTFTKKYLDMLNDTISNAVLATTQTYVETLKKQGKFDEEAQKIAFKQTYDAVMKVLTDDAVKYVTTSVGDLETYVTNRIEAEVKLTK